MNRTYDREWYLERVEAIRRIIPDCALSTDMITGFCSETEEEHQDTISLMKHVHYHYAYMFAYSERPNTPAAKKLADDIAEEVKSRRLDEIIELQCATSLELNKLEIGKVQKVLIEGYSKKSEEFLKGRNSQNTTVVFPAGTHQKGEYVNVLIHEATQGTLIGTVIE